MPPTLNRRRALFVLSKIDQILAWERDREDQRDGKFVELGRYLCEVRAGQYWRFENLSSFDDFLQRRFPESRRKAYYLMSIHEHLPKPIRRELKQVGWSKAVELVKLARRDGHRFESATWLHKARSLPKQEFKAEVERELTGRDAEPSELMYFKIYKSQMPVIEQALDTAALMLGTDRSRGYCLEMICADFLAGAHLDNGNPKLLLLSMLRLFRLLPESEKREFLRGRPRRHDFFEEDPAWTPMPISSSACKCSSATAGDARAAAPWRIWKSTTSNSEAGRARTRSKTSSPCAPIATSWLTKRSVPPRSIPSLPR